MSHLLRFMSRLAFFFSLLIVNNVWGQDKIYTKSGVISCRIVNVNNTVVTYLPLKTSKSLDKYVKDVYFIFNETGEYLLPSKMDFGLQKNQELVSHFLHDDSPMESSDQIFMNDNTLIKAKIGNEDKDFVYLDNGAQKKLDKHLIAIIIYKSGEHSLLAAAPKVADVLWAALANSQQAGTTTLATLNSRPKIENQGQTGKNPSRDSGQIASSAAVRPLADTPAASKPPQVQPKAGDRAAKDTTSPATAVSSNPLPAKPTINDQLDAAMKAEFEKKASDKATQFSNYLKILLNKEVSNEEKSKVINQTALLFVNEDAVVEVSSLNRGAQRFRIKEYLNHIKFIQYDRVELTWTNVQYVTEIKRGMDGTYSGVITFEQKFTGYKDGKQVYSDITVKRAIVYLKTYDKVVDGKTQSLWDVLLGDIGVESTRPTS